MLSIKRNRTLRPAMPVIFLLTIASTVIHAQTMTWEAVYGGVYNESGSAGCKTSDSGYATLGSTFSFGAGDHDLYLLRLNSFGDTLWSKTYGGNATDYGYDIISTNDNGFILVGSSRSFSSGNYDLLAVRVDSLGNTIWQKTFGGNGDDEGRSIAKTYDNNFVICGTTSSFGAGFDDIYLIKIDIDGNLIWEKAYGGIGGETGSAICETNDSGLAVIGSTGSFGSGYSSIYMIRTDNNGDSLWTGVYGGNKADFANSMTITADNGFAIIGSTNSFGQGYADMYILKLDSNGFFDWQTTLGGADDDRGFSIKQTSDHSYLVGGTTDSYGSGQTDIYVALVDSNGVENWSQSFGGVKSDYCRSIIIEDLACVVVGQSYSFSSGGSDVYLLKLTTDQTTGIYDDYFNELNLTFSLHDAYPNPFNLETNISFDLEVRSNVSLTIHNILGQTVREYNFNSVPVGLFNLVWDGRSDEGEIVASGIYFYRINSNDQVQTKKVLLLK